MADANEDLALQQLVAIRRQAQTRALLKPLGREANSPAPASEQVRLARVTLVTDDGSQTIRRSKPNRCRGRRSTSLRGNGEANERWVVWNRARARINAGRACRQRHAYYILDVCSRIARATFRCVST